MSKYSLQGHFAGLCMFNTEGIDHHTIKFTTFFAKTSTGQAF